MKIGKLLKNPFLLVGQGFVLGGLLFFTLDRGPEEGQPVGVQASLLSQVIR